MSPIFFRKAIGAFLVYDVTDKESFYALESWHQQLINHSDESIVVMMLANKCDLPNKEVTYEMGKDFAT